ncbi:carbohydrate sulfotransferase 5-like [Penaeus chinensis]|uniref:carbohydrate sulfotransferase 5-like n=1 Tax=Penaeus chinensis TaxID=139456 RepID=UPI001FB63FFC|nr:carbohydrate sulfotransferase 5-like [Penaeus chinensis]
MSGLYRAMKPRRLVVAAAVVLIFLVVRYKLIGPSLDPLERQEAKEKTNGATAVAAEEESELPPRPSKVVVLWTSWRSGSTFIGQLLTRASNSTFYSYEPLHMHGVQVLDVDDATTQSALAFLKDLLLCRLRRWQREVAYLGSLGKYRSQNTFLWKRCPRHRQQWRLCRNASFVSEICRSASLHVAKVLRLSLRWARPLLADRDLDVRVLYMVRDSRAVLSSRAAKSWCRSPSCRDPQTVCPLLAADLREADALAAEYPHRFKLLIYDKICQQMSTVLEDTMAFLGLPTTAEQKHLLKYDQAYFRKASIEKNSSLQAQLWRRTVSFPGIVVPTQQHCRTSLEKLGLRIFSKEEDLRNLNVSTMVRTPSLL